MSLDCVCVVEHSGHQMPMLDVHVLKSVSLLLPVQLIKQGLLQVNSLDIQNHDETLVVALVAKHMKHVSARIIHIDLLVNDIRWSSQICHQIQHDILETQIAVEN